MLQLLRNNGGHIVPWGLTALPVASPLELSDMADRLASQDAQTKELAKGRAAPSSTNLRLVDERTASGETLALFERYRERFGRADLPGIVLCFATNPALLKGMLDIAENFVFGVSLLERRHKEMIATFISRKNACPYCADSHGALLAAQGGAPELIGSLLQGNLDVHLLTHSERALLEFAAKVNASSAAVNRADVEAALRAGWTEEQIAETVHIAALFAAFNRIANGFGLPSPYPEGLGATL